MITKDEIQENGGKVGGDVPSLSPVCPKLSEVQLKKIVRSKQEYKKRNINLMDYDNGFILQKTMDWSLLNDGMTIPVSVCSLFTSHHIDYFTHSQNNDSTNIISSVRITTALSKRIIRGSIARSSSSSSRMARC